MKEGYFSGWRKIFNISIGIVYLFFNLWLMFNIEKYFPAEQAGYWTNVMFSYLILNAVIFANADLRNKLFDVKFREFIPRFILFFVAFLFVFYILYSFIDPLPLTAFKVLAKVPIWLLLVHAFTFATTEALIWQGFLDQQIGHPWSELTAGIFHMFVWSGGVLTVIISAGLLFAFFSYMQYLFAKNHKDMVPAIASHAAWNAVRLGVMVTIGGLIL